MLGDDGRVDPAADVEPCCQPSKTWLGCRDQVAENLVGHRLVERAPVAIADNVLLECLQFDAELVGHIFEIQGCKIRLPGAGAEAAELGDPDPNGIVQRKIRIFKCF